FFETELLLQKKENSPIVWSAGFSYLNGSDAGGNTSLLSPIVNIRTRLSHLIEVGAAFEPKPHMIGLQELLAASLFYSPVIASSSLSKDSLFRSDPRRIVSEPVHISVFANYFLSLDDELHAELRFIKRNTEPVFDSHNDTK